MVKQKALEKILAQVFDDFQRITEPEEHARQRAEFVFHMTDWMHDLAAL